LSAAWNQVKANIKGFLIEILATSFSTLLFVRSCPIYGIYMESSDECSVLEPDNLKISKTVFLSFKHLIINTYSSLTFNHIGKRIVTYTKLQT
jgi:hypothetical protein